MPKNPKDLFKVYYFLYAAKPSDQRLLDVLVVVVVVVGVGGHF